MDNMDDADNTPLEESSVPTEIEDDDAGDNAPVSAGQKRTASSTPSNSRYVLFPFDSPV